MKEKLRLVSIISTISEDHYEHGEGKNIGYGLIKKSGAEYACIEALLADLSSHYGLSQNFGDYEPLRPGVFVTSKMVADHSDQQNGGWFEPTEEEIEKWKKNELMLYSEDYTIEIELVRPFTGV